MEVRAGFVTLSGISQTVCFHVITFINYCLYDLHAVFDIRNISLNRQTQNQQTSPYSSKKICISPHVRMRRNVTVFNFIF